MLIGNSAYQTLPPLKNPKNDVLAVQRALAETRILDRDALRRFDAADQGGARDLPQDAEGADWAIFYYAGTGIEMDGVNYIVPVDVEYVSDARAPDTHLVRLQTAFDAVKAAKSVRLVVSDACRINPLVQGGRGRSISIPKSI